jgi:hypothetical protein
MTVTPLAGFVPCSSRLIPTDPFVAGSTPQPTGAVPKTPKHDKKNCGEAAVVELRLPAGNITNATNSNPVFLLQLCALVFYFFTK